MSELVLNPAAGWLTPAATSFGLVLLAELGDKSQIVCMTLAARHPQWPVLAGSVLAFVFLNSLAVVFGVGIAHWIPQESVALAVALLFAIFGIKALRDASEDEDDEVVERGLRGVFLTTLLVIVLAEMGDKTQIAVAGLASSLPAWPVWSGATLALAVTSALGVVVGCRLLKLLPLRRLHQVSGVLFLLLASLALTRLF